MATEAGGGTPIALALITAGSIMIYTAVKNVSLVEAFAGVTPKSSGPTPSPDAQDAGAGTGPVGDFKGPHAAQLEALRRVAVSQFHLRITQVCRPANATYGSPTSLHKQCRAFDASGSVNDRVAFARYARGLPWVDEVFCDQAGMVAPGYDHSDHVHVGA